MSSNRPAQNLVLISVNDPRKALMQRLESIGFFDMTSSSVTLNLDAGGNVGSIEIKKHIRF